MASNSYRYPINIDGSSDYIKFKFFKYEAPLTSPGNSNANYNAAYSNKETLAPSKVFAGDICITMPNDIQTSVAGNWGPQNMNGLVRAAYGAVGGALREVSGKNKSEITNLLSRAKGFGRDAASGVLGGLAEDALQGLTDNIKGVPGLGSNLGLNDVLGLVSTFITNPNTELLYQGTKLRTHGYRFKLIAQSSEEADNILEMVNIFKKCAAPKGGDQTFLGLTNRNFIGIPDVCRVTFHQGGESKNEHPYLPRYKMSAITNVGVDYITEGQYMTFRDGKPLGVNLTLEFTELKLLFDEDYGTGTSDYR